MSRDSDKARELAERYEESYWRRDDIEEVALAAMRYAYQEAAQVADADKQMQTGVIADYVNRCDGGASFAAAERIRKVLESRARDLGAE